MVLDNIRSANNVGSFFRSCDAFGVSSLVLCGICATPPSRDIHKSALGAEITVPWSHYGDTAEAVEVLKADGYTIVVVEQVHGAVMLAEFRPWSATDEAHSGVTTSARQKYALVFGNEVDGVAQRIVDMADMAVEIPQVGTKHSLNVAVSGGIVLWQCFMHWSALGR